MRRALGIFWVLFTLVSFSTAGYAGIRNSKHDLTLGSPGPSDPALLGGNELCVYCHTPHDAMGPDSRPLWNHADTLTESFEMYGTTMGGTAPDAQPNTASLRCLSCHDGATAVDAYGGSLGTPTKTLGSPYNVGFEGILSNEHPVSIGTAGISDSIEAARSAGLVFYGSGADSRVECPTCHDPHLTINEKFLRVSENGGQFCRSCHNK